LKAAEGFQKEQQPTQSIKLIQILLPELTEPQQLSQAYLNMAESHLTLDDNNLSLVANILEHVEPNLVDNSRLSAIAYKVFMHQKSWLKAANSILKSDLPAQEASKTIWRTMTNLTSSELEHARWEHPSLLPWIQLTSIARRYALTPSKLNQEVVAWQSQNTGHPLQLELPTALAQSMQVEPIRANRVAVLLPLTGRLASQGRVLKEGFLTAYLDSPKAASSALQNDIQFIDSALKTAPELNELVVDFDVVVGPLIKEKIQALRQILPADKILLALNRVDNEITNQPKKPTSEMESIETKEHYYFSLAPEDEAQQLSDFIFNKQLLRPIIFADDNNITKRMAQAFIKAWNKKPNVYTPELTIFKDIKQMRTSVSNMLDVEQSKSRIKQIGRLADVEVYGKERNRRDIDAIVLFATPEQTGLLNPIIEASLSSFAEVSLSVFATSRSYSQNQTKSSLRDLRNLTFSDMPWLLPGHKWQDLLRQTNLLWPQRKDSLARLFAMGFDSYNLIPYLRQMKNLPHVTKQGLTGKISLEQSGIIRRHLPLAQVAKEKVTLLDVD
ncbi:penicillin-binding protein activator, partial [Paraglaciecola sp.]|uniref:penicillin-binding protein activator n=1 Tax=Paraglaciecola sp. TaxID=1920173 RepID=UPI003EF54734